MSDAVSREDVVEYLKSQLWIDGFVEVPADELIVAIRALPAVQPDARIKEYEEAYQYALHLAEALRENYPPNPDFRFLGDLVGLLTQIDNMVAGLSQSAVQPDPLCECGMTGPCKWTECKAPILSAHVNETRKSEHEAAVMLTPTTKGGGA